MPYVVIHYNTINELEAHVNKLAKEYESFRVVSVFQNMLKYNSIGNYVLAWFSETEFNEWQKAKT